MSEPEELPEGAIELNGKTYVWHQGTGVLVDYIDEASGISESIIVPTDWEPNLSKDEILARADLAYHRQAEIAKWIEAAPEYVAQLVEALRRSGTFETLAETICDAFEAVKITGELTPEERESVTEEELAQKAEEVTEALRQETATIIRKFLITGEEALQLQENFARDLLLDAYMAATYAFEEEGGDLDQDGAFADFWQERSGDFLTPALLNTFASGQTLFTEMIVGVLKEHVEPSLIKAFDRWFAKKKKELRRGQRATARALLPASMLATGGGIAYQELLSNMRPDAFALYEGNQWPVAFINRQDAKGAIEMRPPHTDGLEILPLDEMENITRQMLEQTRQLSQLEAHTLDALCHLWMQRAGHPEARVLVTIDELLALRGLKPKRGGSGRRGGYGPDQRREILRALYRIQNLSFRIDELATYEDNGAKSKKRRRQTRRAVTGPAFVLTGAAGQVRLDGSLDVDRVNVTPGDVLALYLWGPGRQTAIIDGRTLHLDPYRQEPESRIARYCSSLWRIRATKGTYSDPLRVETLLEKAALPLDDRKPQRTRERLEKALDTLQREGIIERWRYKSWKLGDAPRVGWAEPWLRELIIIEPPASVTGYYAEHLRGALPDGKPAPLADRLRETRERLGLTQAQAAEAADLSQQAYSRAERGKGVSQENRGKLETWLSTHSVSTPPSE